MVDDPLVPEEVLIKGPLIKSWETYFHHQASESVNVCSEGFHQWAFRGAQLRSHPPS
jgi:hypothetical protein